MICGAQFKDLAVKNHYLSAHSSLRTELNTSFSTTSLSDSYVLHEITQRCFSERHISVSSYFQQCDGGRTQLL